MADLDNKCKYTHWGTYDGAGPMPFSNVVKLNRAVGIRPFRKFGYNPGIGNTFEDLWYTGANYTFPTSAETLNVSSSEADDSAGGIGMRTAILEGLDSDYNEITETVTLNGTTAVQTVNSYIRLHRIYGDTAGSSEVNVGDITATQSTSGIVMGEVEEGSGTTLQCIYTVPAGYVVQIESLNISVTRNDDVRVELLTKSVSSDGCWTVAFSHNVSNGLVDLDLRDGVILREKTDIKVRVRRLSGSGVRAAAVLHGFIYDGSIMYIDGAN